MGGQVKHLLSRRQRLERSLVGVGTGKVVDRRVAGDAGWVVWERGELDGILEAVGNGGQPSAVSRQPPIARCNNAGPIQKCCEPCTLPLALI